MADVPDSPGPLQGIDSRVPAVMQDDPQKLQMLASRATVQLQRAASSMLRRSKRIRLWGPNADASPGPSDGITIQLLFQMRQTIETLEKIGDLEPSQALIAIQTRLRGLSQMSQIHQAAISECGRITANSNKTLIDLARLAHAQGADNPDDLTDAELAE